MIKIVRRLTSKRRLKRCSIYTCPAGRNLQGFFIGVSYLNVLTGDIVKYHADFLYLTRLLIALDNSFELTTLSTTATTTIVKKE